MNDPYVDIFINIIKDLHENSVDPDIVADTGRALKYYRGLHGIGDYAAPIGPLLPGQTVVGGPVTTTDGILSNIFGALGASASIVKDLFGQKVNPPATNIIVNRPDSTQDKLPTWVLPTAIGGGIGLILLVVVLSMRK